MRRRMVLIGVVMAITLVLVAPSVLAGGVYRGSAYDPNNYGLGEIRYLGNLAGYHFWFTPTESIGPYEEGHSYHNVYKFEVGDPEEWCGPVNIPNREPYNLAAPNLGTAYYKIFDTTTDMQVCP